jgi:hypothetical protein
MVSGRFTASSMKSFREMEMSILVDFGMDLTDRPATPVAYKYRRNV